MKDPILLIPEMPLVLQDAIQLRRALSVLARPDANPDYKVQCERRTINGKDRYFLYEIQQHFRDGSAVHINVSYLDIRLDGRSKKDAHSAARSLCARLTAGSQYPLDPIPDAEEIKSALRITGEKQSHILEIDDSRNGITYLYTIEDFGKKPPKVTAIPIPRNGHLKHCEQPAAYKDLPTIAVFHADRMDNILIISVLKGHATLLTQKTEYGPIETMAAIAVLDQIRQLVTEHRP